MMVWIVEHNHKPLMAAGRLIAFADTGHGKLAAQNYLNTLPTTDDDNYYEAVLYERKDPKE